ncbi:LysR substrate-binding domain-containing protein [Paenibacillus puerhi]|uniref:LysR substrate-binding domain-containing protein n=1 Tax=Paenibacillus puerhi TaxID=2692622 RepID=UPI00135A85FF|nr:LysR substrate-binding domain-containing protein [Paenibacillus puerhi]
MEHRLLEYFLAVCQELHFTKAAEKLGISQPTLSHQIALLEQRIGTPLFLRLGKKIFISEAGEILYKHTLNAFHELEQAQLAIDELRGLKRGHLRIGCSGNHLLTSSLISFHEAYPGIELSVTELATEETCEGLLSNRLDIGVVFLPIKDEHLQSIPLFHETLQLIVSSRHELFGARSVKLAELQRQPVVLLQPKFLVRQMIDAYCQEAGFSLRPLVEVSTLDSLLELARRGIGGAVLPASYMEQLQDDRVHALEITDPVPGKSIGIVYRKDIYMGAVMSAFIRHLADQLGPSRFS